MRADVLPVGRLDLLAIERAAVRPCSNRKAYPRGLFMYIQELMSELAESVYCLAFSAGLELHMVKGVVRGGFIPVSGL